MLNRTRFSRRSGSVVALTGILLLSAPTRASSAHTPTHAVGLASRASSLTSQSTTASCRPGWLPTFGALPGTDGTVLALTVFDDGTGPALYAGGTFSTAGGVVVGDIAKWNGSSWSALSSGVDDWVYALTVFDDGSGPALFAGGIFTTAGGVPAKGIAKWNGSSWSPVGGGVNGFVQALTVFDDGTGPALYVAGQFATAGGVAANDIAKWNGASWSGLQGGVYVGFLTIVYSLQVFDDGSGPALYAGGDFTVAGLALASRIAKWNGSSWSPLGSGLNNTVAAMGVFDDGSGAALYASGVFTSAGGAVASRIAKWNGSSWSALGSGMAGGLGTAVKALTVFDDGTGPALYAGGSFTSAGGVAVNGLAKWNGSAWSQVGNGENDGPSAMTTFDDGGGLALYAGTGFMSASGAFGFSIAKWDGSNWSALGADGLNGEIDSLASFDDGSGPALYAGGSFTSAGGVAVNNIAKWNGSRWSALGSGIASNSFPGSVPPYVMALTVFDDGSGPALYAGGSFLSAGGAPVNNIAKWNGSSWSSVGNGLNALFYPSFVRALAVFDDGTGPALYAGGDFMLSAGLAVNHIARWNGSNWSALGIGMNGGQIATTVDGLAVFDDGSGPNLYAAGNFASAGAVAANNLARWNGSNWSPVAGGTNSFIHCLTAFDDGGGPALYAGGTFTNAGGAPAIGIAKWNGAIWSALGSGITGQVVALSAFDDGSSPALAVGGSFSAAGGVTAKNVAKWSGSNWSALGSGVLANVGVDALSTFDDGDGSALYAGGSFVLAFDSGDAYLAKWGNASGCGMPGITLCAPGIGGVSACPCGNPAVSSGAGCNNSANTGGAELAATGIARLSFDTVVFTTQGETPTALSIVLQADSVFASGVVFGQGVRCATGNLKRLYVTNAVGGSITAPQGPDLHVHARSATLGDTIAPGTHRFYGVYYADPTVLGGCPGSSTFNTTQQLDVLWGA